MIYLDNAATSFPKPAAVYRELQDYLRRDGANPGRGGHQWAVRVERTMDDTRNLLARFFGMDDHRRVIFTLNGTDSLNMAIKGVLRPGDHVVTSLLEHNSVSRPLKQLEADGSIALTQLPFSQEGFVDPEDFRRALTPRTRLVVLLHASNVLGTLQPIAEVGKICRRHEALFLVDAAQTAGVVPIDMQAMQIDLLALPGHKAPVRSARNRRCAGGPSGRAPALAGRRHRFRFGSPLAAPAVSPCSGSGDAQHPGRGGAESRPELRDRRGPGQNTLSRAAIAGPIDRIPQGTTPGFASSVPWTRAAVWDRWRSTGRVTPRRRWG